MIKTLPLLAAIGVTIWAGGSTAAHETPPTPPQTATKPTPKPFAKPFAKPFDCLQTRSIRQAEAASDGHWYARTNGGKWYRNNMECPTLAPRRALVHVSPIGSQCRGDIVQVIDFTLGGVNYGGCGLGSWEQVDGPPPKKPSR